MKKFFRSVTSLILTGVLLLNNSIAVYADEKTKDEIREIVYEALLGEDITNAEIAFDENYKIKSVKNAIGNYAYYQYDDEGINIIRNEKLDTRLTVDESGNIVKYENFVNGAEAEYSYDDENNLIGIYNDDYSYEIDKDDSGVPLELSRNGEMLFRTELEDEKPVSKEFGNGQEVLYNYNDSGLIQSIESDGNILFSFKYDKDGFVEEISNNKTDTSINYAYVDNNVITEYDNGTEIITSYNDIENATEKEIATLIDDYNINLKYDNEDVLNELSTGKSEFQYEYEQIGSYKKITNDFGTFEEELEPNYEDGILTGYKFVSGDDVYYCILDEDGFISEIELNDDLIYSFEYDNKFGQLIEYVDYITGRIYTFDYDDTGNIIYKSLECNDVVEETEYEYNNLRWQDQLTEYDDVEIKYDYIGNITQFGDASLKWTQGNLLSSYSDEDNDIKYYYDENGVRVGKTVNGEETTYIADGYQVIVENVEDHELVYIYIYDKLLGFYFDGNIYYYKNKSTWRYYRHI